MSSRSPRSPIWDAPSRADTVAHVAPLALNLAQSMDPERDSTQLITDALADGASRAAIHDVIVQMVEQVLTMRGEAFAQLDTFSVMLRALPNGHRLTEEFAMGGWVEFEEDAFFGELTVRRVRLSLEEVARVRAERRAAMATLRPMVARSDRLDRALNSFALALFGVADDEREVIRSAVTPGPSFLPSLAAV
jgi:hypothetical protein